MSLSLRTQERAKKFIPGITQLLSKNPSRFSEGIWPAYFSKAKGAYVWDLDGEKYLDMSISGIGACVLGYADDDVDTAVCDAIHKGVASSLNCAEEVDLAEELCTLHPWADQVRFTRSGGEAMAVAVRLARAKTGKSVVLFCGYHGWHDWYLSANIANDSALDNHLIVGLSPQGAPRELCGTAFPFIYNDTAELERLAEEHKDNLAAIVTEPIRNFEPTEAFLASLRSTADKYDVPLIVDEISAGLRYNTGGAHLTFSGFQPDIAVFSKALGNGYAIAAVIGKESVMRAAEYSFISSTNWTERIGPVAALATLRKHRELNVGKHLVALGTAVQEGWVRLAQKHGLDIHVGGMKPMGHFSFEEEEPVKNAYFIQLMLEQGFLAGESYYAMYAHTFEQVEQYLGATDVAFSVIANTKDIASKLVGKPTVSGFGRIA